MPAALRLLAGRIADTQAASASARQINHDVDRALGALLRWSREFGQGVKLGLLLRRTDLNDGQAEAVFGGFQGEGCS